MENIQNTNHDYDHVSPPQSIKVSILTDTNSTESFWKS